MSLLLSAGANKEVADKVILMIHYCMTVKIVFCGPNNNICPLEISNPNESV